jgi:hypothetical protein
LDVSRRLWGFGLEWEEGSSKVLFGVNHQVEQSLVSLVVHREGMKPAEYQSCGMDSRDSRLDIGRGYQTEEIRRWKTVAAVVFIP